MPPAARLRLVPSGPQPIDSDRLYAAIHDLAVEHGFTEMRRVLNEQIERFAKAHRCELATEGWIA